MISAAESSPSPSSISKITTPKHLFVRSRFRVCEGQPERCHRHRHRISARAACSLVAHRKCPPHPKAPPFATVLVGSLVRTAKVVSDDVPLLHGKARQQPYGKR